MKTDPAGNRITYDAENRMTSFTSVGTTATSNYAYDGNGARISKAVGGVTTWFVYNAMGN